MREVGEQCSFVWWNSSMRCFSICSCAGPVPVYVTVHIIADGKTWFPMRIGHKGYRPAVFPTTESEWFPFSFGFIPYAVIVGCCHDLKCIFSRSDVGIECFFDYLHSNSSLRRNWRVYRHIGSVRAEYSSRHCMQWKIDILIVGKNQCLRIVRGTIQQMSIIIPVWLPYCLPSVGKLRAWCYSLKRAGSKRKETITSTKVDLTVGQTNDSCV